MKNQLLIAVLLLVLPFAGCVTSPVPSGPSGWTIELASDARSPDGACRIYDEANHLMLEGNLLAGKMHGTWTAWASTGDRLAVLSYVDGLRSGPFQMWYGPFGDPSARGRLKLEGACERGRFHGSVVRYFPNGARRSVRVYDQGALVSAQYWSENRTELSSVQAEEAALAEVASDINYLETLEAMVRQALEHSHRRGAV